MTDDEARARYIKQQKFSTADLIALMNAGHTKSSAARVLGVLPVSVWRRIKKDRIDWPDKKMDQIDDATFARIWNDRRIRGKTMAKTLGVVYSTIKARADRLGLPDRSESKFKKVCKVDLEKMWQTGMSTTDMAAEFGCSVSSVQKTAKAMGLPPRKRNQNRRKRRPGAEANNGWGKPTTAGEFHEQQLAEAWGALRASEKT